MKAFASALLLAGAHAAATAIEFDVKAESSMVSLSSPTSFLKSYGTKGTNMVLNDSKVTWTITTDHANGTYTFIAEMIGVHDGAYLTKNTEVFEIYQCWKDGADVNAGLTGLTCHIF